MSNSDRPLVEARFVDQAEQIARAAFGHRPAQPGVDIVNGVEIAYRHPNFVPENAPRRPQFVLGARPALPTGEVVTSMVPIAGVMPRIELAPAPPQPLPPPAEMPPREALRQALIEQATAKAALSVARKTLARGQGLVREAEAVLNRARAEEEAATATLGERLRAWLSAGGEGERPVPEGGAGSGNRAQAEAELSAARSAAKAIADDAERCEGAVLQIEQRICGAIERVIQDDAVADAARLSELERTAADLRQRLSGVAAVTFMLAAEPPRPMKLLPPVRSAITDTTPPPTAKALWTNYSARLRVDPEARLDPPEDPPPMAA
jgi:hypothetical protein